MIVRFHFEWPDGTEDSIVLEADTLDELREKARLELDHRQAKNRWSETISE